VTTGARVDGPAVWVHDVPPAGMLATQMVAFVGYVAVFAIRSPDFTAGLARRRDLAAGVALLVLTTAASVVVGARLPALAETGADTGTGAGDLAARLGDGGVVPGGGAFLLLATLAPALVAGHSARRCLHALALPRPRLTGMVAAVAVTALAVGRPDRSLLPWLAALGAALPALVVPLTLASRRRRGRAIPTWTWLPGVAVAVGLGLRWHALGLLTGLAVTGLATYGWSRTANTGWPESLTQRRFTS
jgi:cytosine permease